MSSNESVPPDVLDDSAIRCLGVRDMLLLPSINTHLVPFVKSTMTKVGMVGECELVVPLDNSRKRLSFLGETDEVFFTNIIHDNSYVANFYILFTETGFFFNSFRDEVSCISVLKGAFDPIVRAEADSVFDRYQGNIGFGEAGEMYAKELLALRSRYRK